VRENNDWIEDVHFVSHHVENVTSNVFVFHVASAELKVGDLLPDSEFTDENGNHIHLSDFRGRVLAFTFFFSRCPLPDFCPRMSKDFAETRQLLLHAPDAPTNWQFLSISFDPEFDQPSVLSSYADFFRGGSADRWLFAAAPTNTLAELSPRLDLIVMHEGVNISHNLRTVVLDPQGRIARQFDGNAWTSRELADAIIETARAGAKPPTR
jgi:protein SCO1/2